ncbi:MAG: hypothetical protein JW760_00390 [Spirochaetales bacterium]|nr:hypothetical protein [Spirochaetales bacterium]
MQSSLAPAAQVVLAVVPVVGIVMGGLVLFFYFLWNHRQKVLLIQKDLYKKIEFDLHSFSVFAGLLLLSVGLVLTVLFVLKAGLSYAVLGGLIPLACGISCLLFAGIKKRTPPHE